MFYISYECRASLILYKFLRSNYRGRKYLLPVNICPIVPAVFHKAKVGFDYIDIDENHLCIDRETVLRIISQKNHNYEGVFFVRTYGHTGSFEKFFNEIKSKDEKVIIIDDRCLSIPQFVEPTTIADVVLYSTGYSKFVDIGWGGFAFIKNNYQYKSINIPYNPLAYESLIADFKLMYDKQTTLQYRDSDWLGSQIDLPTFDDYQSLVMSKIPEVINTRTAINQIYRSQLPLDIQLQPCFENWRFNIRIPEGRDLIIKAIFDKKLFCSKHYIPLAPAHRLTTTPIAKKLGSEVINLFNDFRYDVTRAAETAEIICKLIKDQSSQKAH